MTSPVDRLRLARSYGWAGVSERVRTRLDSESVSYGVRRDLRAAVSTVRPGVAIEIRPLRQEDVQALLDGPEQQWAGAHERDERLLRLRMIEAALPGCLVAVTPSGEPCYMQWLMTAEDNDRVRAFFGSLFPALPPDTVLLEGAYTPLRLRRLAVMPAAMAHIAERGARLGARWAIAFMGAGNLASIEGARRAGFEPYVKRVERWRRLRREVTFLPLETGPPPYRAAGSP